MFHINALNENTELKDKLKSKSKRANATAASRTSFIESLSNEIKKDLEEILSKQLKEVDDRGRALSENPNIANLRAYKHAVSAFLKEITKRTMKINQILGRRIDYKLISVINERLESLSMMFLKNELSHLSLIANIDEIRGMIVDMMF